MRRRDFVMLLGGAAAAWPLAARAQQPAAMIGYLGIGAPVNSAPAALLQGLKETGYVEGRNLTIEYRWASYETSRLPELAADLVRRRVRVIVALGSGLAISVTMAATDTIPIVFGYGGDPVEQGYVASLNRPGGNVTGLTSLSSVLVSKQLGLLHDLLPQATRIGMLINPRLITDPSIKEAQAAASAIGATIQILPAGSGREIDVAFARVANEKSLQGLLISNDPLFIAQRRQLVTLLARQKLPAIHPFRQQAEAGGLMSYGPDINARDREVGHYIGRILNGEKPADLPVQQQSKFEFIINLKTAKAIGVNVSNEMQLLADQVIE
jgi:putative ABC transport system substrate-binding protein